MNLQAFALFVLAFAESSGSLLPLQMQDITVTLFYLRRLHGLVIFAFSFPLLKIPVKRGSKFWCNSLGYFPSFASSKCWMNFWGLVICNLSTSFGLNKWNKLVGVAQVVRFHPFLWAISIGGLFLLVIGRYEILLSIKPFFFFKKMKKRRLFSPLNQ